MKAFLRIISIILIYYLIIEFLFGTPNLECYTIVDDAIKYFSYDVETNSVIINYDKVNLTPEDVNLNIKDLPYDWNALSIQDQKTILLERYILKSLTNTFVLLLFLLFLGKSGGY